MNGKEIVKYIVRQKKLKPDAICVVFNTSIYETLKTIGVLSDWQETTFGSFTLFRYACGLHYIIDNSYNEVRIMNKEEYLEYCKNTYL